MASAAPQYRFDLAAGPLTASVARIAALAHVSIATSDPSLLASRGRALRITGTVGAALSALLEGTRAAAIPIGENGWRIVARQPRPAAKVVPHPAIGLHREIVVTGSKRDRLLSNYPGSVSIIDGVQLTRFGTAADTNAMARIDPALQSTHLGPGRDKLFLRGIADSSFNGSGAALVGIYVNDLRLTYNAPDPALRFYDIDRVEILEGPQSTLYGAGSMAGLVRITPRTPDLSTISGEAWAGATSTAQGAPGGDIGGVINIPLVSDHVALRILAYAARDGGYIDDAIRARADVNRTGTIGGRATVRMKLGDSWTLDLSGIAQEIRNSDAQYAERDRPELTRASIAAQPSFNLFRAGYVVLSGRIGSVNLSSTTGIVDQSLGQKFLPDDGNGDTIYHQHDAIRLLTEEIRLSSQPGAMLGWVAGISALKSRSDTTQIVSFDGFDRALGQAHNNLTDLTAFGELTIPLVPTFSLTAGGRFSSVRLAGRAIGARMREGPIEAPKTSATRHEKFAVPSLALGWTAQEGWLVFVRYSEGYRPGGQTASGIIEQYDADRLFSLESGMRLLSVDGGRLSGQFSAAISRWNDIQADALGANGTPITRNIGDGRVLSVTGSIDGAPTPELRLRLAAMLARGHVTGPDPAIGAMIRTPLPNVARDTLAGSIDWQHDLSDHHRLSTKLSANHVGRSVLGSGLELSQIRQGGYWLVSGGVGLGSGGRTISLDIDNLLDSHANSFAFGTPTFRYDSNEQTPLRPRTIRIGVHHLF